MTHNLFTNDLSISQTIHLHRLYRDYVEHKQDEQCASNIWCIKLKLYCDAKRKKSFINLNKRTNGVIERNWKGIENHAVTLMLLNRKCEDQLFVSKQ